MRHTTEKLARTIFRNTGFVMLGNTILKVLNFLFTLFVIRKLGDARFGQYATVISFVSLLQIFVEFGMSQYVMREIARDRQRTQALFWNLVIVRFILGLVGVGAITAAAAAFQYPGELVIGVLIYTSTFLISAFQSPLQMILTANEQFGYVSLMNVVGQVAFILFGSIFLFSGLGFFWLIVASALNLLTQTILGAWIVRRFHLVQKPTEVSPRMWPQLIRSGLPFGMISLSLTIAFNIDTVILSKFVSSREVGWYNVAYNLIFSIMFISTSFKEAMTPSLSKTFVDHPEEVERWYYRMVRAIIIISLPIAVGGMLLATPLIQFLYSDQYLPSARAFQIIIWDVPVLMFAGFGGNICAVVKEEHKGARVYIVAAVANILMNLIAIPRFGYLGASVTTVLTDLIAAVQFYFFFRGKLKLPNMAPLVAKIIPPILGMALVMQWLQGQHLLVVIILGAGVYGILSWAIGLFDPTEKQMAQRIFHKIVPFGATKEA
jgi:O-antigen/teichoic acid export membrane protein